MGIQGLLQFIKDASEPVHVQKYKGQTVAVDTYCWLHKGAFSCAEKLAKGEPTDQYVSFCMKFVDMLLSYSVKPILVFDGRNLPSKQEVEKARRERRQANLQRGKQLLREGKLAEARDCFTRCVNVTPSMAHEVIKAARARGVDCIVAPYEADAQLAFLNKTGVAQAVITEDSDLLAFGCKKVILKMDKQGHGLEIAQCHLGRCRSLGDVFTEEKFRYMCILSGCDYLASLYGIGLGKACKLLRIANNPDILKVIRKIGQYLKMNITVPDDYVEGFVKANNTFLYQLVFDPVSRKVVPLNPYPENVDPATLGYAGENVGDEQGLQMALGNVDINTMKRIDDFDPDAPIARPLKAPRSRGWGDTPVVSVHGSIWSRSCVAGAARPRASPSPQKRARTLGKEAVVPLRGLKLPHREPQVKRPRQDSGISDEDVLDQYGPKRQREEAPVTDVQRVDQEAGRSPVRARNRFATLLQWRNRSEDGDGGQGTRSRFFASSDLSVPEPKEPKPSDKERSEQPGLAPSVKTEPHADSATPRRASLSAFGWSGCSSDVSATSPAQSDRPRTPSMPSGLSALQQFQRKTESRSWGKSDSPRPPAPPSPTGGAVDIATPPGSPPSQDSAYFSQSNREPSGTEDSPPGRLSAESPVEEKDPWRDSGCSGTPSDSSVTEEGRAPPLRTKVSGLSRTRPGEHGAKIRPSAPARASGLRKKLQGKKAAVSNENNPGMQATISSLWKNFSFNKQNPRLNAAKKADAASPVNVLR